MSRGKPSRVSGVLVIDKPAGMTSHDVVNRVRRLFDTSEVGHTGTLDPMATGVLPVLVGRAVKASDLLLAEDKRYEATMRLGIRTDTEDTTGTVLSETKDLPPENDVLAAVRAMQGDSMQVPPMYSALKVGGQKLCDLARAGKVVEREARPITVREIKARRLADDLYELDVACSKGTYIRTLCADIGKKLGCGAAMASLRRTASGTFSISDAVTLDALAAMTEEERLRLPRPVETLFADLPAVTLPPFFERLFRSGCEIYEHKIGAAVPAGTSVRVYGEGGFIALGRVQDYPDGPAVRLVKLFVL
ncbi:MAG: tRNA pseudouridine(55) synthase TruB [Clostridia bacterium]|nr:tRNA pseudouridine(55) synthase TruB [Clostridia bacterium]